MIKLIGLNLLPYREIARQTKKAEFQRYKSAALVMARNKEEQTKLYKKQQEALEYTIDSVNGMIIDIEKTVDRVEKISGETDICVR